jgi:hypothetical protein
LLHHWRALGKMRSLAQWHQVSSSRWKTDFFWRISPARWTQWIREEGDSSG